MPTLSGIIKRFAKQPFMYWEKTGENQFSKPLYATGVELKCRWEDRQREVITKDGRVVLAKGYLLLDTVLTPGSLVWKGSLAEWQAASFFPKIPTQLQGAYELVVVNSTPGLPQLPGIVCEAYI